MILNDFMKQILTIIIAGLLSINCTTAQETLTRKEKKEKEKIEREKQKQEMLALVKSRYFVLEATRVQDKDGHVLTLTPTINFVSVEGEITTLQFALDGMIGWNGLGGVTLEGTITGFTVNEGKPGKYFTITMRVSGAGMYSHQFITVYPDGRGELEVMGDGGARFVFSGRIRPLSESSIYKTRPDNK